MAKSYRELFEAALQAGLNHQQAANTMMDMLNDMLEIFEAEHPEIYEAFERQCVDVRTGGHYDEDTARAEVAQVGGEHWSLEQTDDLTKDAWWEDVPIWDRYVALNVTWHELEGILTADQIVSATWGLYFNQQKHPWALSIWERMNHNWKNV